MRLIDAEKLHRTRFHLYMDDNEALVPVNDVVRMIALAPTVDIDDIVADKLMEFAEKVKKELKDFVVNTNEMYDVVDNIVEEVVDDI